MKKFAFVVFTMVAGISAIGCGSSACDDYAAKAQGCCDKLADAAKTSCEASLKTVQDNGDADACQAALDLLGTTCD